ncbi:MAG: hypothetical protein RLZZ400_392, partial [Actinomycetota bacterium]
RFFFLAVKNSVEPFVDVGNLHECLNLPG